MSWCFQRTHTVWFFLLPLPTTLHSSSYFYLNELENGLELGESVGHDTTGGLFALVLIADRPITSASELSVPDREDLGSPTAGTLKALFSG